MKCVRQEGYEDGFTDGISQGISQGINQGITQSILELLEDLGAIPQELQARILSEKKLQQLKAWLKLASKAESLEHFINNM